MGSLTHLHPLCLNCWTGNCSCAVVKKQHHLLYCTEKELILTTLSALVPLVSSPCAILHNYKINVELIVPPLCQGVQRCQKCSHTYISLSTLPQYSPFQFKAVKFATTLQSIIHTHTMGKNSHFCKFVSYWYWYNLCAVVIQQQCAIVSSRFFSPSSR